MELTLEILLFFIRQMEPVIYQMRSKAPVFVGIKQFYAEDTHISSDYLYVCDLAYLWMNRAVIPDQLTVLASENAGLTRQELESLSCNLILVSEQYKTPYILNQMIGIFGRMANWDKGMHIAALEGRSPQDLLDLSEEVLEHPVIVFDAGFNVLAHTRKEAAENQFFTETIEHGYSDSKVMRQIKKHKILSKLQDGGPLVAPAAGNENKYNIYLRFFSSQKLLGYACIFCDSCEPESGYLHLLKYFTENMNFCLQREFENQRYGQMMHETFLVHLMNPEGISKMQLEEQLASSDNLNRHGRFVLGVLNFEGEKDVPIEYVAKLLQTDMWDVKLFIYEEQICLLKAMDQREIATPTLVQFEKEHMGKLLAGYTYRLGVSHVFHDVLQLRHAYTQAKAALQFGKADDKVYCKYDEYYYFHMFSCLEETLPVETLKSEIYLQLQEYDRQNHTQYATIILSYLEHDCNATHTAEALFLHRNTVRNAVQFVEDRWKIDVSDTEEKKRFVISHLIDLYKAI